MPVARHTETNFLGTTSKPFWFKTTRSLWSQHSRSRVFFILVQSHGVPVRGVRWSHRGRGSGTWWEKKNYLQSAMKLKSVSLCKVNDTCLKRMVAGVFSMLNSATGTPLTATWGANMAAGYTTDEVPTCKARYPGNREKGSADYYKLECCQLSRLQLHAVIKCNF